MATPTFDVAPAPPGAPLPVKEAARHLGMSATPIRKGLAAGVYPNLSLLTVGAIATRPILISAVSAAGHPIPVLRLRDGRPATDLPPRRYFGFLNDGSDAEMQAGADRWWTDQGKNLVLAAQALIVACGGITVGFLDVDGILAIDSTGRIHYDAQLVGRCYDAVNNSVRIIHPSSPNAVLAQGVLGLRVLGGSGGSITSIRARAAGAGTS
jgi:hypothetical protein